MTALTVEVRSEVSLSRTKVKGRQSLNVEAAVLL